MLPFNLSSLFEYIFFLLGTRMISFSGTRMISFSGMRMISFSGTRIISFSEKI